MMALNDLTGPSAGPLARIPYFIHSNHYYVSAKIKIEQAVLDISFSSKIYLKSQADWEGILDDHKLDWVDGSFFVGNEICR